MTAEHDAHAAVAFQDDRSEQPQHLNRQRWDFDAWPEMYDQLKQFRILIFASDPGVALNMMVFTVASNASGCRHCTAHGAYGLHSMLGIDVEKVRALWSFEDSPDFDERERTALRFANAAGLSPNQVTPAIHEQLRAHFSDAEVRTLLGVVSVAAFMNRWNDSLATVTDDESREWAEANLGSVGWSIGKHVGADHERRAGPPGA